MKKIAFLFAALCVVFFSCNNSSDAPLPPPVVPVKKASEWLFLFYFDGDDTSINDDLYTNIREIECALAQTRNADGSPKEGYASVTALLLWDGISEEKKGNQKHVHPDGALFEIGADDSLTFNPQSGNEYGAGYVSLSDGFSVGANTKDLTLLARAAGWLAKEPDMSDPETFTNFLKFAAACYTAPNVVVCLQDHGAGTHKETYTDTNAISRSLCSDASSSERRLLTCKNITDALNAAGYVGSQKPKILWNDVCLQATAEIVWNYKGCADYYCASPNVSCMPNYYGVFTNIKSGMTALDVGKVIVSAYFERYYMDPLPSPGSEEACKEARASGGSVFTSSFMSLDSQKVDALKVGVDKLAEDLLALKTADEEKFKKVFDDCVRQNIDSLAACKGLVYNGTYAWLNDLGWLCNDISVGSSWNGCAAKTSAKALFDLLEHGDDKLIIYAWGGRLATRQKSVASGILDWDPDYVSPDQLYLTGQKDFVSQKTVACEWTNKPYGLTIVGSVRSKLGDKDWPDYYNPILHYDDWTGFSTDWGQVIKAWWDYSKSGN